MENFLINNREMKPKDWGIDVAVAMVAFLFGCGQLMLTASSIIIPDMALRQYLGMVNVVPSAWVYFALALTTFPVVLRRRFPWPVFLFVTITFLGLQNSFNSFSLTVIGPVIALYTIACERGLTEAIIAAALSVFGLLVMESPSRTASLAFFTRFQNVAFVVAGVFAGYAYRAHRAYVRATEQRAMEAERSREEEAARRVEQERVRIAREVHDITAHSLSAVSIQAAAAERLVDTDPTAAKQAIATARVTAKNALEEIRSMIGVLRHGDDRADTEPTAGTERLDEVVSFLKGAQIMVSVEDHAYERERVPAYVDMALFGIAREAATNVVRHANATRVHIWLSSEANGASLQFRDNGIGVSVKLGAPVPLRGGHGLAGMAERVGLLGGTFMARPIQEGGFIIQARIPFGEDKDSQ